jgi:hypothetical protein
VMGSQRPTRQPRSTRKNRTKKQSNDAEEKIRCTRGIECPWEGSKNAYKRHKCGKEQVPCPVAGCPKVFLRNYQLVHHLDKSHPDVEIPNRPTLNYKRRPKNDD